MLLAGACTAAYQQYTGHAGNGLPAVQLMMLGAFVAVSSIDWETWYHAPGMPPVKNDYDTSLATAAYDLAVKWHTADVMGIGAPPPEGVTEDDIKGWGSEQVHFACQSAQLCLCSKLFRVLSIVCSI